MSKAKGAAAAPATAAVAKQEPLPNKEAALYRDMLKLYDEKLYKKAVKTADNILKKHPEHGETLALKGVCLFNLSKKAEGYDLLKQAAKHDIK